MRMLLDTHVWLWTLTRPERLDIGLRDRLADPATEVLLSVASVWEIAIKYRLGRLPLPDPPDRFIPARLVRDGVTVLPVEMHHAAHVANLPDHHADPFDRLIIAQAQLEGLTLVTADHAIAAYPVTLWRT